VPARTKPKAVEGLYRLEKAWPWEGVAEALNIPSQIRKRPITPVELQAKRKAVVEDMKVMALSA